MPIVGLCAVGLDRDFGAWLDVGHVLLGETDGLRELGAGEVLEPGTRALGDRSARGAHAILHRLALDDFRLAVGRLGCAWRHTERTGSPSFVPLDRDDNVERLRLRD